VPFISFETQAFKSNLDMKGFSPFAVMSEGMDTSKWKWRLEPVFRSPVIRRPTMGFTIKERSPATLSVLKADGTPILLNNMLGGTGADYEWLEGFSGATVSNPREGGREKFYTDFTLMTIQEERKEKFQIMETFGENFVFFFGQEPRFISCGGLLVNTADFPWRATWLENYDKYLRGTKCAENKARVYLSWDDIMVEGYLVSTQSNDTVTEPNTIPFSFVMLLTGYTSLTAMNLGSLATYKEGTFADKHGELLGSLAADVTDNGRPIALDDSLFLEQVKNKLGLATDAEAQAAVQQMKPKDFVDIATNFGQAAGQAYNDAQTMLKQTPLTTLIEKWADVSPAGERQLAGVNVGDLASLEGARKLFGPQLDALHSFGFFNSAEAP
jgi:hypothetical protein